MREFRYGIFLKVFIFIFCPGLIALFVLALLHFNDQNAIVYFAIILPASLAMIALSVYGIADVSMGKCVITNNEVILQSPFGSRSLAVDEIRGYRRDENYITIIPLHTSQKEIKVSKYFKDAYLIVHWLEMHYNDLNRADGDEDERQVLQNDAFGITEKARLARLNRARRVCKIINGAAWFLLIWLFVFPRYYYAYAILSCVLYPLIAIFVTLCYRGLISADEHEDSKMPSLGIAFILPGIILGLRALMDFDILVYPLSIWIGVAVVSISLSFLYILPSFRSARKRGRFYATGLLMIFLNFFYSYGAIVAANCMLDNSQPTSDNTTVVGKRISDGKIRTYYLDLSPWGTHTEIQEAKVTPDEYASVQKNDVVVVRQYAGYLAIPWIKVTL